MIASATPGGTLTAYDYQDGTSFRADSSHNIMTITLKSGDFITGPVQERIVGNSYHLQFSSNGPFTLHTTSQDESIEGSLSAQIEINKNGLHGEVDFDSKELKVKVHPDSHVPDPKSASDTVIKDFISDNTSDLYNMLPSAVTRSVSVSDFAQSIPSGLTVKTVQVTAPIQVDTTNGYPVARETVSVHLRVNGVDKHLEETWVFVFEGDQWKFEGAV